MPYTPGPFTVEELGESAETERALGVTRIVCAPAQYETGEKIAVAFVVFPDDAPLFAASEDLLGAAEDAEEILRNTFERTAWQTRTMNRLAEAIAAAKAGA